MSFYVDKPPVTAFTLPPTIPVTQAERGAMAVFGITLALVRLYGGKAILRYMRRNR